jgi:AcrR family transcriptional regulator
MADDISGRGDPLKSLQLLWGGGKDPKRGPKSKVALSDLVQAAVTIADSEGIEAVSTRRVAEAVGISSMSFYTHIPNKAVLVDLMLDAVSSGPDDTPMPEFDPANWRSNVQFVATALREFYLQHPWMLQVSTHRPVIGPNTMRSYEAILRSVDGLGLDEVEMDMTATLISNYVFGAVRDAARAQMVKEQTGLSDDEWWAKIAPFLDTIDFSPYPVASRVGPIVGELYGVGDPDRAFAFGLARLLDGVSVLVASKAKAPEQRPV